MHLFHRPCTERHAYRTCGGLAGLGGYGVMDGQCHQCRIPDGIDSGRVSLGSIKTHDSVCARQTIAAQAKARYNFPWCQVHTLQGIVLRSVMQDGQEWKKSPHCCNDEHGHFASDQKRFTTPSHRPDNTALTLLS